MNKVITTFTDFDNRKWRNRLVGGKADDKEPSDFNNDDVRIGTAVEREHSNNPDIATEIAIDHISENPFYYDQLISSGIADEKDAINLYNKLKSDEDREKAEQDILNNMEIENDEEDNIEDEGEEIDIEDEGEDDLGTDKADIDEDDELIVQEKNIKNYKSFIEKINYRK